MSHAHPVNAATVQVECQRCKSPFMARVADRKRGWGKFCSKSCKAIKQTQRTGYSGPIADDTWLNSHDEGPEGWDGHKGYCS